MSSTDSPPIGEKYRLMKTVCSIFKKPFTLSGKDFGRWEIFSTTLFKFNSTELETFLSDHTYLWGIMFAENKSLPEPGPILSHRLANVAISCMQYLHRWDSNTLPTRDHFLASWVTKLKHSPWLWRRRMRVTPMGRRQRIWNLRLSHQDHQVFDFKTIQSEYFCQEQRIFYTWTLDILYLTLRKAMKSDELTRALSKPFIPSLAPLLFPRRVKRVRKAAAAYLEKVSRRASCLGR